MGLKHRTVELVFNIGLLVAISFCVAATAYSLHSHGMGAEAAAWIQAGGSIAALSGAAWLAKSEIRRQHAAKRRNGEDLARGLRFALQQGHTEAHAIAWEIVGTDAKPDRESRRHWQLRTRVARQLLTHYAERVDHLHPSMIHLAVNGVALLDQLDEDIDNIHERLAIEAPIPAELSNPITWYLSYFEDLLKELDSRMRGIAIELDKEEAGKSTRPSFWESDPRPSDA